MKAKVIKTGEIVELELVKFDYTKDNYIENNGKVYYADELDFNLDTPQKQSVTIEGWVARGLLFGSLYLYDKEPLRNDDVWECRGFGQQFELPADSFPDLKWEDEPKLVTIQITEK